jgi:MoaA/NifB/PqqE/SkfB family radical SAM enzyme
MVVMWVVLIIENNRGVKMNLCKRGLNYVQVYDDGGNVRICSWTRDGYVGSLLEHSFNELYHGSAANELRSRLANDNYCECNRDDCPWLACGEIEQHKVSVESPPQYPDSLYLAYENVCNYNCTTCNIHERMEAADKTELEKRYDTIEEKLKEVLPHIKHLSANGQGEIFASRRILKLMREWNPVAPDEDISVTIETNGSLFDEEHFKEIQHLGKYYLSVSVTVMSFDEYTYQQLSGTKLSISRIVDNLKYIKSLRDNGIINYLTIATVVQERNFREMPAFARRCIEEFGADYVRLRSFVPWGKKPLDIEWFTDVINPHHPYHDEYVQIMKDPIFKHPKVHDWSGGIGTCLGEHPYKQKLNIESKKVKILNYLIHDGKEAEDRIKCFSQGKKLVVYGFGDVGKSLVKLCKLDYAYIIDMYCEENSCDGLSIYSIEKLEDKRCGDEAVIITVLGDEKVIENELVKKGYDLSSIIRINKLFAV